MRILVFAGLLVWSVGCGSGGHGPEATPSPTVTPTPLSTPTPVGAAHRAFVIGPFAAVADGGASIMRSDDSGQTFARVFSTDGLGPLGLRVAFADEQNGWAIDRPSGALSRIFHTSDGGTSWASQNENVLREDQDPVELHDLTFITSTHGVAVGAVLSDASTHINRPPLILVTTNGGVVWTPAALGHAADRPATLEAVCMVASGAGLAVGSSVVSGGMVLRTTDGGSTWSDITANLTLEGGDLGQPSTAGCAEAGRFWVGGRALRRGVAGPTILFSADGGATWTNRSPSLPGQLNRESIVLDFVDDTTGWAIIEGSSLILHTEDAGLSWQEQPPPTARQGSLFALDFVSPQVGVVVGALETVAGAAWHGLALTTQDGGATWQGASLVPEDVPGLADVSVVP